MKSTLCTLVNTRKRERERMKERDKLWAYVWMTMSFDISVHIYILFFVSILSLYRYSTYMLYVSKWWNVKILNWRQEGRSKSAQRWYKATVSNIVTIHFTEIKIHHYQLTWWILYALLYPFVVHPTDSLSQSHPPFEWIFGLNVTKMWFKMTTPIISDYFMETKRI